MKGIKIGMKTIKPKASIPGVGILVAKFFFLIKKMKKLKFNSLKIPDEIFFNMFIFLDIKFNINIIELVCKRFRRILGNRVYNQKVINLPITTLKKQYLYAEENNLEIINFIPENIHKKCSTKKCDNYICKGNDELSCGCCGEYYCIKCLIPEKCSYCGHTTCKICNSMSKCNDCGIDVCDPYDYSYDCSDNCSICHKVSCSECTFRCESCDSPYCNKCSIIKDNEKICYNEMCNEI